MVVAKLAEGGAIATRRIVLVPEQKTEVQKVTVTEFRTEIVGGKAVARPVTSEKEVPVVTTTFAEQVVEMSVAKDTYIVRDIEDKKIEGEALSDVLGKERPVLLVQGTKSLDPFYAAFFKPGTLVVYMNSTNDKAVRGVPAPVLFDPTAPRPVAKPLPLGLGEIKIAPPPPPPTVPSSKPPK